VGQDVEELRHDIERRREDLGATVDAIGDRISPGRIITRRRNRMSEGWQSLKDRVMGTMSDTVSSGGDSASNVVGSVKDHVGPEAIRQQAVGSPLGVGVVAFGIGFIVAAVLPPSEAEASAAEKVKEKAQPITGELAAAGKEIAGSVKEHAAEAGQDLKEHASQAASEVKSTASDEASSMSDDAKQARDQVQQTRSS